MGATSVTGVGHGSADGFNKGSDHQSLSVARLIGPRIVAAGVRTLSSNVATIQVPLPTSATADYCVQATAFNATTANAVAVTVFTIAAETTTQAGNAIIDQDNVTVTFYDATISFKGAGATDVVHWAVVKIGNS